MLAEVRGTQSRSYWDGTFPRFPASGYSSFDLRSVSGAKGGSSNNILPAQIAETLKAVAKRRAALRARLRVACRRLRSEQFRTASMSCRPRCGRLSVRQHGSVSCWWSLLGGRPHVGHEAAAVHHAARRRGGRMAARGARAASTDVGDRVPQREASGASMAVAFRQGLSEAGYVKGRNLRIEYRWAEGHYERLAELADDLVRRQVA